MEHVILFSHLEDSSIIRYQALRHEGIEREKRSETQALNNLNEGTGVGIKAAAFRRLSTPKCLLFS